MGSRGARVVARLSDGAGRLSRQHASVPHEGGDVCDRQQDAEIHQQHATGDRPAEAQADTVEEIHVQRDDRADRPEERPERRPERRQQARAAERPASCDVRERRLTTRRTRERETPRRAHGLPDRSRVAAAREPQRSYSNRRGAERPWVGKSESHGTCEIAMMRRTGARNAPAIPRRGIWYHARST